MARVRVTDPLSGATLTVEEGSPQALAWGVPSQQREKEPQAEKKPAQKARIQKSK